ncbi:MAG: ATP-binding protein [Phycisphaerae bacterium]|jgi:nitrogen fixation/metabolism regulation signal transduction histidine kinase|nr:ATP-binding protein [Phycisphaerae bacterium]
MKATKSDAKHSNGGLTEAQLRLAAELTAQMGAETKPETLQKMFLERAITIFGCKIGAIATSSDGQKTLKPGPVVGKGNLLQTFEYFTSKPIAKNVLGKKKAVLIEKPAAEVGLLAKGLKGIMAAPLLGGGRFLGILTMADKLEGKFTPDEAALLQVLANLCATVSETTGAFFGFKQQINERMAEVMSELNRASTELKHVKAFNEDIFQCITMGVIVFDRDFKIIFRNLLGEMLLPAAEGVLEALGQTKIGDVYANWETAFRDTVGRGQVCRFDDVAYAVPSRKTGGAHGKKNGDKADDNPASSEVRLNLTCSPLVSAGRGVAGGILTTEDVSDRWSMANRLAVSERLAAVGRLAARVAHELNNPLDGVLRFISLAQRVGGKADGAQGNEKAAQYLEEARKGVMRMAGIIGALLEFSRSTIATAAKAEMCALLHEASETLAGQSARNKVNITVKCQKNMPSMKGGNLYQVFLNLMKNAIDAMPDGGTLEVDSGIRESRIVTTFSDTGEGIAPDVMQHIFEPFYSTKPNGRGTGLGLAICKDIVEKEGGQIEAANRPKGGTVFTVTLPIKR